MRSQPVAARRSVADPITTAYEAELVCGGGYISPGHTMDWRGWVMRFL
jgi:hypothetical protein